MKKFMLGVLIVLFSSSAWAQNEAYNALFADLIIQHENGSVSDDKFAELKQQLLLQGRKEALDKYNLNAHEILARVRERLSSPDGVTIEELQEMVGIAPGTGIKPK